MLFYLQKEHFRHTRFEYQSHITLNCNSIRIVPCSPVSYIIPYHEVEVVRFVYIHIYKVCIFHTIVSWSELTSVGFM